MELAPIIVFSYNRPDHLRRTLEALGKNEGASESILYIFCDGPKLWAGEQDVDGSGTQKSAQRLFYGSREAYDEYLKKIQESVEIACSTTWPGELKVITRDTNLGLAASIVGAVTEIVQKYGRVITLEDDVVTSPGFLRYMNDALEIYRNDDRVMHVSAYMYPHRGRLPETFFYPVPYPGGGWATWLRAWKYYSDDSEALYNQWKYRWKEFDIFGGNYLSQQLICNYNGTMRTWFVKWYAVMLNFQALSLYPHQSLTNNIGFDDQATNCHTTHRFDVKELSEHVTVVRKPIRVNRKASRIIYDFYQGHWYNKARRNALIRKVLHFIFFWK